MPNYSNTVIYKIECIDLEIEDIYVGHTTNFKQRMVSHKCSVNNSNRKDHNLKIYRFIRENGGWDNWSMREVIQLECVDKNEALTAEREYIELLGASLNTETPGRTDKECNSRYRKEHPEKVKEWQHNWYMKHRDKHLDNAKQYRLKNADKIKNKKQKASDA